MGIKLLSGRAVIAVRGADAETFLNGLLTISTLSLNEGEMVWAGLLTPQGKVLFDGLLGRAGEVFYFDVAGLIVGDMVKRLSMYKLRAAVEITDVSTNFVSGFSLDMPEGGELVFKDMRHEALGYRVLIATENGSGLTGDDAEYHQVRIGQGVPEFGQDYASAEVFPHDIGMDLLGGVDFKKGCYVGQEVVSRMSHKTTVRKRPVLVQFEGAGVAGVELSMEGKKVGAVGSVAQGHGIAIVRLDKIMQGLAVMAGEARVTLSIPDWATYGFGEAD